MPVRVVPTLQVHATRASSNKIGRVTGLIIKAYSYLTLLSYTNLIWIHNCLQKYGCKPSECI